MAFLATQYFSYFWGSAISVMIGIVLSFLALKEIGAILEIRNIKELMYLIKKKNK
jgi:hypothetical protein